MLQWSYQSKIRLSKVKFKYYCGLILLLSLGHSDGTHHSSELLKMGEAQQWQSMTFDKTLTVFYMHVNIFVSFHKQLNYF